MMRYGIPRYRLPRDVLDAEIDRVLAMGVSWSSRHRRRPRGRAARGGFDAVFLAVGAQLGRRAYIPAGDRPPVLDAVTSCTTSRRAAAVLGRRVAVYGGGNTAMDAARTAAGSGPPRP